jgi:hypothetical protein
MLVSGEEFQVNKSEWMHPRELQLKTAIQRTLQHNTWVNDLRLHGIRVFSQKYWSHEKRLIRKYSIPVFQTDALGIFTMSEINGLLGTQSSGRWHELTPLDANTKTIKQVAQLAVRTIYLLGLDYGIVTIVTNGTKGVAVTQIDATDDILQTPLGDKITQAISKYKVIIPNDVIQLGLDPEFILKEPGPGGKIVGASTFLKKHGPVGCDSLRVGNRIIYPLVELRPAPAEDPVQLFRNLYRTMRLASTQITDQRLEWLAGGMPAQGFALGGHIHFSGVPLNSDVLRVLDNFLALPLVLIEDETTKKRRPRYGVLGDFRVQFHGGFEYRTLPSWIMMPKIALGVITLARLLVENYRLLQQRPLLNPEIQKYYYLGDKEGILPIAESLWEELESIPPYLQYRNNLMPLKRMILHMKSWKEKQDFRPIWKIPPFDVSPMRVHTNS